MKHIVLLSAALLILSGCTKEQPNSSTEIPFDTLMKGLGVHWWVVEAPQGIEETDFAGVAFVEEDGTTWPGMTWTGWAPGARAYVFIGQSPPGVGENWIRVVHDSGAGSRSLSGPDGRKLMVRTPGRSNEIYEFGEVFAKLAERNSLVESTPGGMDIGEGEVGMIFAIKANNINQSGDDNSEASPLSDTP